MLQFNLARAAGALVLAAGLAGCMDVTMDIEVVDTDNARATRTIAMERDMYMMMDQMGQQMAEGAEGMPGGDMDFCEDDDEVVMGDDTVTCVNTVEGSFAEVLEEGMGEGSGDEPQPTIVAEGNGLVRVTYPTGAMAEDMAEDDADPQAMMMMNQMFEGKTMTLSVTGGEVVETNMTRSDDGMSARLEIPMLDMMTGEAKLPKQAFAVVRP